MNIIGIDPSAYSLGYCIAKGKIKPEPQLTLVDYGIIKFQQKVLVQDKLVEMFDGIGLICKNHQPDIICIEDVYIHFNSRVALTLSMVKAATMIGAYKACDKKPEMFLVHATTVKKNMISGRASKEDVAKAVSEKFDIDITDVPHDVTDAIAVAYTGLIKHTEEL